MAMSTTDTLASQLTLRWIPHLFAPNLSANEVTILSSSLLGGVTIEISLLF